MPLKIWKFACCDDDTDDDDDDYDDDDDGDDMWMHMHMALTTAGLKESYVQFKLKLLFSIPVELLS